MARRSGEENLSVGTTPLVKREAWSALLALAFAIAASFLVGCNVVQGFQDAGDTLFPEQKTYLAAPGLRLVSGGYHEVGFAVGADIYLLARRTDDTQGGLVSVPYGAPRPCLIPSVGRYWASGNLARRPPLLAYFNEDTSRGTLHFADANCRTFELEIAEATLPVGETESSIVVWSASGLWLVTPESGQQQQLTTSATEVMRRGFRLGFVVRTGGSIVLFNNDWTPQGEFGRQVGSVRLAGQTVFFADSAGVHRLVSGPGGLEDQVLAADACGLGMQDTTWATFRAPCSGGPVFALHEPSGKQFQLPFSADPERLKLVPARGSRGLDPSQDPFWFFTLRDGESEASQATLVVKPPSGDEFSLGAHASFQQLSLRESPEETHGYALVEVTNDGSGRYLWWDAEGHTKVLAERVLGSPSRLVVDFDGSLGKLAVASGDRLLVLTEGVPWPAFEYRDSTRAWTVLFHDLILPGLARGQNGQLSAFYGTLDSLQATPLTVPFAAPNLELIAPSAGVFRVAALGQVLSGVMYLADFDEQRGTGRLDYHNLDLRFSAHVNDGVSDFRIIDDQVLYAIPRGKDAGIWLVSGK
ncbi:MAG TPA: hypothetical protein VJV79_23350 [Polyangiaceae bacterium]|nr:hypothetical protein [Polyangiaceae bacterium]